jgi:hypothetical protein
LPDQFIGGLSSACLQGRAQIVPDPVSSKNDKDSNSELVFYLDGAHSPESMEMCARWFAHVTNNDGNQPVCLGQPHTVRNFRKVCITVQFFFLSNPYLNVFQFFLSSPLHILLFLCTISNLFEFFVFSDSPVQLHDCKRSSKIASMSSRYMCSKWYAHQTPCFFFE